MAEKTEQVITMCPITGEGQHALAVLTSTGRIFERLRDPKATNFDPANPGVKYIWREIKSPVAIEVS